MTYNTTTQKLGSAAGIFNGTTAKVTFADITVTTNFTINAWFNSTTTSTGAYVFGARTAGGPADRTYIYLNNGALYFTAGVTTNNFSTYNDGTWHMATLTKAGTTYKSYIDGIYKGTFTDTTTINTLVNPGLGVLDYLPSGYFPGDIDDSAVWNAALTDGGVSIGVAATGEIGDLYNSGDGLTYADFTT